MRTLHSVLLCAVLATALSACGSTVQSTTGSPAAALGADGLPLSPEQAAQQGAELGIPGAGVGTGVTGATAGSSTATGSAGSVSGGGSGTTAGTPQAGTTGPGAAAAPVAGARNTSPISLGILTLGSPNGAAAAIGAGYSTSATSTDVARALVRHFNKNGGISGRKIEAVEYEMPVTSSDFRTQMQAACAKFTEDNKVVAALSVLANAYYDNYEQCLSKAGVPHFAAPTGSTDETDLKSFPGLVSVTSPTTNRRFTELLQRFVTSGYFSSKSVIGVVVEACPYNVRAYDQTIAPLAKRLGLRLERRDISCINGFGDAGNAIPAFANAVLPFRSAGVDRVMFVSNYEGVGLLSFENNAASQGYEPSYALTSTTGGAALAGQFNDAQLQRMRGVGWTPVIDVAARVQASPTTKRCRNILAKEGVTPQSKADDLVDLVCDQFFLLEATLKETAGSSRAQDLLGGVRSLATSYVSPYALKGATDFSTRRDGPRLFAIWGYSTKCRCMDYLSPPS